MDIFNDDVVIPETEMIDDVNVSSDGHQLLKKCSCPWAHNNCFIVNLSNCIVMYRHVCRPISLEQNSSNQ